MKFPREFYIPQHSSKVQDKNSDAVVYVREVAGKFWAVGFLGKQAKPAFNYTFKTEEARAKYAASFFKNRQDTLARKQTRHVERRDYQHSFKVGDIFSTHWGYDQTNIEHFECVEVLGKMIVVREIAQEREETGHMTGRCVPVPGKFIGEPLKRLAAQGGVKICKVRWASYCKPTEIAGMKVYESARWSSYA